TRRSAGYATSRLMPRARGGGFWRCDGRFRSGGLASKEKLLAPPIELDRESEPEAPQEGRPPHVAEPVMAQIDARKSHHDDEKARNRRPAPEGWRRVKARNAR